MSKSRTPYLFLVSALGLILAAESKGSNFRWDDSDDESPKVTTVVKKTTPKAKADTKKKATSLLKIDEQDDWPIETEPKSKLKTKKRAKAEDPSDLEDVSEELVSRIRGNQSRRAKQWYSEGGYAKIDKHLKIDDDGEYNLEDMNDIIATPNGPQIDDNARELLALLTMKGQELLEEYENKNVLDSSDKEADNLLKGLAKNQDGELRIFAKKVLQLKENKTVYEYAVRLLSDYSRMGMDSDHGHTLRSQLQLTCDLPWDKLDTQVIDLVHAKQILDRDHFGMDKAKERIIEYLATMKRGGNPKGTILCFVGPPGVGKTTLAESIAEATGRKFVSVALGGVHDESAIRGHAPAYVGSDCGDIFKALRKAGTRNPVMLLDEIEKLGTQSLQGNPAAALLEVLDPAQNGKFMDHYIDIPFDLSKVLFIASANVLDTISGPLLDRMEVIEISSYTPMEKMQIAKKHLMTKCFKENGVQPKELYLRTTTLDKIISEYTNEAGVRNLSKMIAQISRKVVTEHDTFGQHKTVVVEPQMLEKYLGPPTNFSEKMLPQDTVGHIMGLAYTSTGGCILPIEVSVTNQGSGTITRTGKLGDIIKESCDAAWSAIKGLKDKYGLTDEVINQKNLHVHFYEASTPKDGPSAGAAIATTMVSALTNTPIRRDLCMTGEITILGLIQPIGGLKEKLIAAHRAGMKIALIPKDNVPNLQDVPDEIKKAMKIVPVSHISQVLDIALVKK